MVQNISPPLFSSQKKFTKDVIIETLAEHFPLPTSEIFKTIKQNYHFDVSYQAIRKSLNLLAEQKVVTQKGKEFQLNKTWILKSKAFMEKLEKTYMGETPVVQKYDVDSNTIIYTLKNLIDKDTLWCNKVIEWIVSHAKQDKRPIAWQGGHCWWVLGQLSHEDKMMSFPHEYGIKHYLLNLSNTFLDQNAQKFYDGKPDVIYKTLKKSEVPKGVDPSTHIIVFGDYIMQSVYPREIIQSLNEFYTSTKTIADLNLGNLMKILKQSADIKITLMKNAQLAERLREDIIGHYN